jgi:hypothetical protein
VAGWLFVIGDGDSLRWVLGKRRMAFRAHVKTSHLSPGDATVIYATRGCWHNPTRDRAQILAIGSIASPIRNKPVGVAGETMPQYCDLVFDVVLPERGGVPFTGLVEQLSLTKGRANWGPLLHRTIVSIGDGDVAAIRGAVERVAQGQTPP